MKYLFSTALAACAAGGLLLAGVSALGNIPGGGTGTGPNVTLTDNGSTVAISNGVVSILCNKSGGSLSQINYTYNNGGGTQTQQLLNGGTDGGMLYWENSSDEGLSFNYSLVASPANTAGNYAEISMVTTSVTNDVLEVHFSMLRGSPGFYVTAIYSHQSTNAAFGMGECRDNIYAGSIFNWMSVDTNRNRLMEVAGGLSIPVQGAPQECYLWTNGIYAGQYEDKYKYSADLGVNHVWGWSSVGTAGKNVGLWNISASSEYYNGGPLKRELMEHIGTTILNMLNGGHYGMGADGNFTNGEVWTKVCGPYFIYCNNVTNTLTGTNPPAQALYQDALAQGAAEQSAWPYAWFTNANYAPTANRGVVSGQFVINDSGNPNASAAGLWVGLIQQPATSAGYYDFQEWMKPYQFWVQADTNGNFTIPNVIAGTNYTLYAFGPGSPDTFLSQAQMGGSPPFIVDYPATQFAVTVTGGATNNLGTTIWTPTRVGPTVFELGYPNHSGNKFRHGDDYWVGDIGPSPASPSPVWSKWLEYPFDFPNGPNYMVGENRWTTDWNFIQPIVVDSQGNDDDSSSTISFNLAQAPANGATASLYLGLASDYYSAIIITVNGNNLGNVGGVTGSPNNSIPNTGYYAGNGDSDTSIREGNNAAFSDERLTFPASLLQAGLNTINIGIRQVGGSYFADHAMYDYIRLELTGYVPPPPASVAAYAGNGANLVCWPVTPGATSYNVLRSTNSASGFVSLTNGVTGPVCGSGSNNAVFVDALALNGTTYYYQVQAVNPTGVSSNSPASPGATPSPGLATSPPPAPTGLGIASSGHHSVTVSWNAAPGADFYSVWRSIVVNTGGGSSNTLNTIILDNTNSGTSYTDTSPTDGGIYKYYVTATSAGGTSTNSTAVIAVPLPAPPAAAPASLTAFFEDSTNVTLNWSAVPGAVGYVISRATSPSGPFLFLQSVTETTYTDYGLSPGATYYYRVAAVNAAAASANNSDLVNGLQPACASLSASATNAQVALSWSAASGATNYSVLRGTNSGGETVTVIAKYTGTNYTDTSVLNGTTYYYLVVASGPDGAGGNSPEASATPTAAASGTWDVNASGNWGTASNWIGGMIAYGSGNTADFSTLSLAASQTVILDSDRTISELKFGDEGDSYDWTLAGTNTLTLGDSPDIDVVNQAATISAVIAGTGGLTKTGLGSLTLGGAAETFTNGLIISGGSLTLDFSAANSPATDLIPALNTLTLDGGTLVVNGVGGGNVGQSFAGTVLDAGGSVINLAANGAASLTNTLGAISESPGGAVEFIGPATINGAVNVAAAGTNYTTSTGSGASTAILGNFGVGANGAWATVGLYDWAATTNNGTYNVIVGGSQVSGFYQTAGITTAGNYDVNPSGVNSLGNAGGAATLRFNNSKQATITFTATTAQNIQGILVTPSMGSTNANLSGDGLEFIRSSGYGNCYGVVWQNNVNAYLNFSSIIEGGRQAGQYNGLVQAGPGTVVYTGSGGNNYELGTYLDGGFSVVNTDSDLGVAANASTVTLNGGTVVGNATFTLDNAGTNQRPFSLVGNGGGLAATSGNTLTVDGVISGSGPLAVGIPASSANRYAVGLLPGSGPGTANATAVYATGTVTLSTNNVFTGDINLYSGTLKVDADNNYNNPVSGPLGNTSVPRNINVYSNATLDFILGNALGSTITTIGATLVINRGATVTDTANDIETFGSVLLNGGTLTGTGGADGAFQMYDLRGTVTVGGVTPSTISGPATTNGGYHLASPTVFNVADVTGNPNSDLTVSGLLVDQDGAGTIYGHLGAPGSLEKTGAGTMTLSATNTYTGGTLINAGILNLNAPDNPGVSGPLGASGTITFGGGTLQYSANNQTDYSGRFSTAAGQAYAIDTAGQNVTFASALTASGGTLTKFGAGTLTLSAANTYSGGTVVNAGTLAVGNDSGSATGPGNVTVGSGAALAGTGSVAGSLTLLAGATLVPGDLNVGGNLTLANGSATFMGVQHSPETNTTVMTGGLLTLGGTLVVSNSAAAAFVAGDNFNLFSAGGGYAGTFGNYSLPALNPGLFWSTAWLPVNGTIGVVSSNPPVISGVAQHGGNLVFTASNGTPNWFYTILTSTNLTLPLSQWTPASTNVFDANGNVTWTNPVTAGANPQMFYAIRVQ